VRPGAGDRLGVRDRTGAVCAPGVRGSSVMLVAMPATAYKNRRLPHKSPLCAICGLQTRDATVRVHLTHGVSLWLCPAHASDDFRSMNSGRDFVATMTRIWHGSGSLTSRRAKALSAQLEREQARGRRRGARPLPGSYHWKALRNEVEHRAAAGEPVAVLVRELRDRHRDDVADVPSERTIRRWYHDGRWRDDDYRTPLRPGFEARDARRAGRAQRDRAAVARLRESHGARSVGTSETRDVRAVEPSEVAGADVPRRVARAP
jgi:hypothetical protein